MYDIAKAEKTSVFFDKVFGQMKRPFIIQSTGYYLLQVDCVSEKWRLGFCEESIGSLYISTIRCTYVQSNEILFSDKIIVE